MDVDGDLGQVLGVPTRIRKRVAREHGPGGSSRRTEGGVMAMSEDLVISSSTSFRRYSDCVPKPNEGCNRVGDLVSSNNQKNEQLNELSQMEAKKNGTDGGEDEADESRDEIDDDWFSKLVGSKELARGDATSYGLTCGQIPLLCDEDLDFKEKTMRTLRVGLKKIWRRGSATITAEDPTYKVAYLGNVLTGWAKGEGCVDKPLNTLWKNYNSSTKPDVQMKISVTQSGLKAVTKEHGLIEYWSHRITYCAMPPGLPRIFCWVYRHEGRKLKQELRCHAVLCSKESVAARMAATLKLRLTQALLDFKRDKLLRQNARLSLANSVYENPSLPRRKILLSTGSHNYKPPLERSKSAPKLGPIEESLEEEESTPKARRKPKETVGEVETETETESESESESESGAEPEPEPEPEPGEAHQKAGNLEDKCEYKLANLNFVKKLCSSIENLVESTSNYSKKLLTERKSNKEFYVTLKRPEESILRKVGGEEGVGTCVKRGKVRKNVSFERGEWGRWEPAKCTEYKRLEEEEEGEKEKEKEKEKESEEEEGEGEREQKAEVEFVVEVRDLESDEGSNSLQSISSCCSDVSSLVTNSSDRSVEPSFRSDEEELPDFLGGHETPAERLHAYLSDYESAVLDDATEVILHPTGERRTSPPEDDIEHGYIELPDSLARTVNLDSKKKDLPYHKIIKSTLLRPGRTKPSCLHV